MDLHKAIHFIESRDNEQVLAQLRYVLKGERPSAETLHLFFNSQQPDGGFLDIFDDDYTSISETCCALADAEQLGLVATDPVVADMLRFLVRRQREDGRFAEEDVFAVNAPEWSMPGSLKAELSQTAEAGYWLALFGYREQALRAAQYLTQHLDIDSGELPTFEHSSIYAAGLWWQLGMTGSAECVLQFLADDMLKQPVVGNGPHLTHLLLAGMPRDHWLLQTIAARLETAQEEDGSFFRYANLEEYTTLEVLRGLVMFYGGVETE